MSLAMSSYIWLACLLTLITHTTAQSDSDTCEGNTTTYHDFNLTVPFQNLCGKDIGAKVDFLDPTFEETWSDCMGRCVKKEPLCYGFDFRPLGATEFENCWLMNATFDAATAVYPGFVIDAAMLAPDLVEGLDESCETLGLRGCFLKNGRLEKVTASSTSSTPASSATSTNTNAASTNSKSLPNGAKGGIAAGIVALAVLVALIIAFVCIRRRKQRARGYSSDESAAEVSAHHQIVEMLAHKGSYSTAELPCQEPAQELEGTEGAKVPIPTSELEGSSPKKPETRFEEVVVVDARTHRPCPCPPATWI